MKRNRFFSLLLAVMMLVTAVFPIGAFADDYDGWEEEPFASQEESFRDEFVLPEEVWDIIEEEGPSEEYVPEEEIWVTPEEGPVGEQPSGEDAGAPEENLPGEQEEQAEEEDVLEAEDSAAFDATIIVIVEQPADQKVEENATASFSVRANGMTLTYRWYYSDNNGASFKASSATDKTYSFKVSAALNGRQVKCLITDANGNEKWSNVATVTVKAASFQITQQPANQNAAENSTVTFTVAATGSGLKYLWYVKDKSDDNFRATSNTTASLSFKLTADRNGRQVKCLITDASGSKLWSKAATATIKAAASIEITQQPANQKAEENGTVTFTVAATGSGLKYLWYVKDKSDDDFRATSNTTTSLSFKLTADRNGRQVKCRITDANGRTAWTNIATATFSQTPIRITKQPTNQKSAVNGTVTFETAATGNGIKYLWYVKDKSDDDFRATSNTTASLSFKLTTDRNGRQVKCLISDASGKTAWTNAATATIATLKITAQPQNQEAKRDENVSFSVSASGSDLSYLWYVKDKSDDDFRATSNTTTSISFKLTTERNGRQVKCLVSDPYGNEVFTRVATAVIQAVNSIVITEQPVSQTVAKDKTVSFEVGATGDGLSFRWYCKDPGDSAFRETSVTDTTLSFKLTEERDGRQVKCLIKDAGGFKAWTNVATATIAPNTIRISQHPSSTTAEVGDTVSFSVSATGSSLTYQWEELLPNSTSWRNTSLSGSKTNNLCFTAKAEHNGRTFRCVVSDTYGYSKTSNEAKLTVNDVQTITVGNFSIYIGTGEAFATLRFVPTRSGRYTLTSTGSDDTQAYLYTVSGTLLAYNDDGGENTNFLISHDLTAGNTYYYEVGYYSSSMTGTINLTLSSESSVQITQQPSSVSVAAGSQASFSVTASGDGTLSYKWQEKTYGSSSWQDMSGSTSSTLSFFTTPWQNGNGYRCVVTDSGATATSNQANLTVTTPTIYTGSTTASINTAGASAWYKFTPSKTGRYTLTSTGSADTKCYLYSSSGSQLAYNDDGGENTNFLISYDLTGNTTYYYQVKYYSSSMTGTINLALSSESSVQITQQPSHVSVAAGYQASFSVTASGDGTLSYKWQEKTSGSSSWEDISGSTSSTLSFFTTPWLNGSSYRCVVTGSGATATSNQANLTVTTPTIYTGSTTATINTAGASAWYRFTPSTTGSYTLTSTGSADTKCYLYNSSGTQLAYNDDGGENTNFLISYSLTAGYTYYYQVRFYSSTATGSISLVMSADSTPTPTTTRYRALLIGNEDYADGTLPGCINDANAMNRMLSGLSNSFSCTQRNSQTAAQIKSAISTAFSGATNNDVSLFYYSGHGMGSDSSSMLGALVGINYSNNYNDYLTTSALASELSKVPGRVIVILDSCHSGAAINKGIEDPEASAEAFNQSVIDAFAAYDSTVYVNNEKVGELATSKFIVITACRKDQTSASYTYTSGSNSGKSFGAFTKCFVEGCGVQYFTGSYTGSMPADSNSNNQLTVYEIYTYAQTEASALNSGQTAQYYASNSSEVLFRR